MLLGPFDITVWGSVAYASAERGEPSWPAYVLRGLVLFHLILAVVLLWRHRNRLEFALPVAIAGVAFTAMSWFVSAMSIANDWI